MPRFRIGNVVVGDDAPTAFIAEVASNHDGSLDRAKMLCKLAKESGASIAKFQNFQADKIVSRYGFEALGKLGHHTTWDSSVYDIFKACETPLEWTPVLKEYCDSIGIEYMSTPYDIEAVDYLDPYVNAFKVGSGDITYTELLEHIYTKRKPVLLSTGASSAIDVHRADEYLPAQACIMQCNTNYSGDADNIKYANLSVLSKWKKMYPGYVLGLSDHSINRTMVTAAVALGARVIERHFSDDPSRPGPDHHFATSPHEMKRLIQAVRELELMLGSPDKVVCENEKESVIVQRRCLRAKYDIMAGEVVDASMVEALRPAPLDSISPDHRYGIYNEILHKDIQAGDYFREEHFVSS